VDDVGDGLLPGEQLLWTGGPVRGRVRLADAGLSLYLAAGLVVLAAVGPHILHKMPPLFIVAAVLVWGAIVIQSVAMLVYLLALKPRIHRGTIYQITDRRVLTTSGLRQRRSSSAYLDQIDEPTVRGRGNGTEDLVLRASRRAPRAVFSPQSVDWLFGRQARPAFWVLGPLTDAGHAQQVTAAARQRMLDGLPDLPPPEAMVAGVPPPAVIGLVASERVLWTGRPGRAPWWFGPPDVYLSAFALLWLVLGGLLCAIAATSGAAFFLVAMVPFVAAGGLYPSVGRIVLRHRRISRSTYLLTSARLITVWQLAGSPVAVQAELGRLLPPELAAQGIITTLAWPDGPTGRRGRANSNGWKALTWPAATTSPPALVGIADPRAVRDLICAAQLAIRAANPRPLAGAG
jgi:hypothetical protein